MRRLIERLKNDLDGFIEQRDDLVLLLRVSDDHLAVTLKVLRDLEQASEHDLFLLFGHDFDDAAGYVHGLVAELDAQRALVDRALADEGRGPLPAPPREVNDARLAPGRRLVAVLDYARSLAPTGGGSRVVCVLAPACVRDRVAWLSLVGALIPHRGVEPWMRSLRLIVGEGGAANDPRPDLHRAPRTRFRQVDFSPAAIEASIREDVADPALPEEARMQALVTEASLDYAHGRATDAIAKYQHLLGHYQHTGNLTMQAVVMLGLGDVCRPGQPHLFFDGPVGSPVASTLSK